MSDVIDFNKLKSEATNKDIDKLEQYVQSLYDSMSQGKMNIMDIMPKITKYMEENNISEEKFINIQDKLIDKYAEIYGLTLDNFENQMKDIVIDMSHLGFSTMDIDYDNMRENINFHEKYKEGISVKPVFTYYIKNETNDLDIILDEDKITILSAKKVNLDDTELNEFLASYKKLLKDKSAKITLCEKSSKYEY